MWWLGWAQQDISPSLRWAYSCVCDELPGCLAIGCLGMASLEGLALLHMVSHSPAAQLMLAHLVAGQASRRVKCQDLLSLCPQLEHFFCCIQLAKVNHKAKLGLRDWAEKSSCSYHGPRESSNCIHLYHLLCTWDSGLHMSGTLIVSPTSKS